MIRVAVTHNKMQKAPCGAPCVTVQSNGHCSRPGQTCSEMDAGHVPELGCASTVQEQAPGSTHEGGSRVLTQHEEVGKGVCAAKAVMACMFPQ